MSTLAERIHQACPCYSKVCHCGSANRPCRCVRQYRHDLNLGDVLLPIQASRVCPWQGHALAGEVEAETKGLRLMISCEEGDRDCAKDKPDPPDLMLSRCFSCQLEMARNEAEAATVLHEEYVKSLTAKVAASHANGCGCVFEDTVAKSFFTGASVIVAKTVDPRCVEWRKS